MRAALTSLFEVDTRYQRVTWFFLRGLALIYFIAFVSLAVQIDGLAGPHGILPFAETLQRAWTAAGWRAIAWLPSVFWFSASDLALKLAAYGGAALAVLLFFGRWPFRALVGMFVLYLSLFHAGGLFMSFQWDTLLLETGFLAIFLARGGPTRLLVFMLHWLLFRFRFMSGVSKLASGDPSWTHLTALNHYFETQVLPHTGSWYFHQLPEWMHVGGVLLVYVTELVVPLFIFLPRPFRLAAAGITLCMQGLIMLSSNHNFVNLLVMVLCLFLLDDKVVERLFPAALTQRAGDAARAMRAFGWKGKTLLAACSALILSASTGAFLGRYAPLEYPAPLKTAIVGAQRFGLGHVFHVYPTMQTWRQELDIQGSNDGVHWRSYAFKYKPGPVNRRPPVNIPHQPRLDWMMWFLPPQTGQDYWLGRLLQRLHQGSPQVLRLFASNPFPEAPPRYLRVMAWQYRFTTPQERAQSGHWWVRRLLGEYPWVPPRRP